jgi:ubiquinone/menaquinone biosynthesis C-methylase UbiE
MFNVETTHWWYVGMRRIWLTQLARLPRPARELDILDAGCGTGIMLNFLETYGRVTGMDISEEALRLTGLRRGSDRNLVQGSIVDLPFPDASFDWVTSFDVVCQVDDYRAALREFHRVLRPGGWALINVPAYEWLRSEHDAAVHVRHRFTLLELEKALRVAGLRASRITYTNTALFPLAALVRLARRGGRVDAENARSDLEPPPPLLNRVLIGILEAESLLLHATDFPFGLSILAAARKGSD